MLRPHIEAFGEFLGNKRRVRCPHEPTSLNDTRPSPTSTRGLARRIGVAWCTRQFRRTLSYFAASLVVRANDFILLNSAPIRRDSTTVSPSSAKTGSASRANHDGGSASTTGAIWKRTQSTSRRALRQSVPKCEKGRRSAKRASLRTRTWSPNTDRARFAVRSATVLSKIAS